MYSIYLVLIRAFNLRRVKQTLNIKQKTPVARVGTHENRQLKTAEWLINPCRYFLLCGGAYRIRTDDLFHAMEAR
jgi:hypothetical protein